ncbi:MAG: serine/threonine protein kinase [Deltaproteobacteria bacterium]|nr:serine/threonine protein kinase [Deltaproteobacteria bacterium]
MSDSVERFGKYRLEQRLAVGGMAEIFLAKLDGPVGFQKELVIKRILPNFATDPDFVSMFLDEAKLVAQLAHPNLVQVFELGSVGNALFLAMEYVDGLDLYTLLRRMRQRSVPMPPDVSVSILLATLRGLHYAHEKTDQMTETPLGLVHRDVSPSNILVSRAGYVKVTDFGIAKAETRATKTRTGVLKGKFAYMAPEHAQGKAIDRRADLFAVGLIAFELFSGRQAYADPDEHGLFQHAVSGLVPTLTEVMTSFSSDVSAVIEKALAYDPDDRFPTCAAFAAELARASSAFGPPADEAALSALVQELDQVDMPLLSGTDVVTLATSVLGPKQEAKSSQFETTEKEKAQPKRPGRKRIAAALAGSVVVAGIITIGKIQGDRAGLVSKPSTPSEETRPASEPTSAAESIPAPPPAQSPPPARAMKHGFLTINAKPWANVFIDGRDMKMTTPVHDLRLFVGNHRVRLESPGAKRSEEFVVEIQANKTTTKIVNFNSGVGK